MPPDGYYTKNFDSPRQDQPRSKSRSPPLEVYACGAEGGFGEPGAAGALGAPGAPGVGAAPSGGSGALQNGQFTGRKFGETIFLPHSGQTNGPDVVSGGLKHMTYLLLVLRESISAFVSAHIIKTMGRVAQRTKVGDA